MSKQTVVHLVNVSKKYFLHGEKPVFSDQIFSFKKKKKFVALNKINLTISKNEIVGIIGNNGSGKTSLLKLIAQISKQTTGQILTQGRVISIINLGAGFHQELTGIENIYLNGVLMGMYKSEVKKQLNSIIKFANIGNFINEPFYSYSEGMKLKLEFAIAIHSNPDLILLDENLFVGDSDFQDKMMLKLEEFIISGKTIIIASQLLDFIELTCNRVLLMHKGSIVADGKPKQIINIYKKNYVGHNN